MSWRTEQNGFIKTWAQDVRNSYKVRLKYVLVPKGVQTDVRFIDTPYRFQSYQEAREYAMEDKGYVETKSGKMKKADMLTKKMPVKKKGKMMKGKR